MTGAWKGLPRPLGGFYDPEIQGMQAVNHRDIVTILILADCEIPMVVIDIWDSGSAILAIWNGPE